MARADSEQRNKRKKKKKDNKKYPYKSGGKFRGNVLKKSK